MKMMVVDDSLVMRRKIERTCHIPEITSIVSAGNGREALEVCARENPDIVTMDLTMPEMDGVDCVKNLIATHPHLQILVVSALSDKATAIQAIQNGARGFLCKPIDDRALNNALQELVKDSVK